mgnify:CR=1 FL=1
MTLVCMGSSPAEQTMAIPWDEGNENLMHSASYCLAYALSSKDHLHHAPEQQVMDGKEQERQLGDSVSLILWPRLGMSVGTTPPKLGPFGILPG